ncbi:MAG: 3-phosphoserine/phosphohydroxythreonine transaminase [Myxococcales bacterium]|nr:3-phosphoserine/phosphohydroxythreonine transaminase [Myxococcales bacterium]
MTERKHNFNAGPAALPYSVLEQVHSQLLDFDKLGLSLMEMSHRSPEFDQVINDAKASLTRLYSIPDTHEVMFLQGGASLQFAMIPYNLGPGGAYINTGTWSTRAYKEACTIGTADEIWSDEGSGFKHVPQPDELPSLPADSTYLHYTSNNTIYGTQYQYVPDTELPLICDMSSDFISRPINVADFDLIYAGAQKNAGPSGVTVLIIKKAISRQFDGDARTPKILRYLTQAEKGSMYNTPNTFGIWVIKLVAEWVESQGGLAAIHKLNQAKANRLYGVIDAHPLCVGHATDVSRSLMNVTFRMDSADREQAFIDLCKDKGIIGMKGHRSVGGLRASIYNAVPQSSVETLAELLASFRG